MVAQRIKRERILVKRLRQVSSADHRKIDKCVKDGGLSSAVGADEDGNRIQVQRCVFMYLEVADSKLANKHRVASFVPLAAPVMRECSAYALDRRVSMQDSCLCQNHDPTGSANGDPHRKILTRKTVFCH